MLSESERLLVVDDNPDRRRAYAHVLRSAGYTVVEAETGGECLQRVREYKPDLLLLDVALPDLSGIQVCQQIKADPELSNTFVALCSAIQTGSESQIQGLESGADEYIVTPISNRELVARVRALMRLKHAQAALRASQLNLQALIENTDGSIWSVDTQYRLIVGNAMFHRNFRAAIGRELGPGESVLPSELPQAVLEEWRGYYDRALRGEQSSVETGARFSPTPRDMEYRASPIKTAEGQIVGVTVFGRDITAHKHAEEALRESARKILAIFSAIGDGITVADRQGRILEANDAAIELHGFENKEEFLNTNIAQLVSEIDRARLESDGLQIVQKGGSGVFEYLLRRKDDSLFLGELRLTKLEDVPGIPSALIAITRDITGPKQIEETLRQSEDRFSKAFHANPVGLIISTVADGRIVDVNTAYCRMTEYAREDLIGKHTAELNLWANPADHPRLVQVFEQTGHVHDWEVQFRTRSGQVRTLLTAMEPINLRGERCLISFALDITARKQAEVALQKSQDRFVKAFHASPAASSIARLADGCYLEVNDSFLRLMGFKREELIGKTSLELSIWANPEDRRKVVELLTRGEGPHHMEIQFRPKSGEVRDSILSTELIELGGETCILASRLDITERKRAEERLAFQAYLLTHVNDAIVASDENDKLTIWNSAAENMYGWKAEEVLGQIGIQVTRTEFPGVDAEWMRRTIAETGQWRGETTQLRKDGTRIPVEVSFSVVRDRTGQISGYVSVNRDITARKRAEEEIRQLNTQLEQRVAERTTQLQKTNQELEAFAYSVSHDLRAPLRAIDGYTRILAEDHASALDAEGQRVCQVVRNETQRMGQLIDDLLTLSRLGRAEMRVASMDMAALVQEVFDELTTPKDRERIDFHIGALPPAAGDRNLIRQVWANLLSNALKFSSKRERAVIEVGGTSGGNDDIYYVRDNGAGFEMEYADKLFGVFQRLHGASEFEGTGVGLAIVQRVIHRHGGRVWGEGEVDRGATFYFALPRPGG